MVQFEHRLARERGELWTGQYLDYSLLKRRIKEATAYKDQSRNQLVDALTVVFIGLFDNEVEKVNAKTGMA